MPSELEGLIFPYFFGENRILGCLGGILEASWIVKSAQELPKMPQDLYVRAMMGPMLALKL